MSTARYAHTATLLADGRVLVAGGIGAEGEVPTVDVYDPATNTWTPARSMSTARRGHTATLLDGGQVLVTGGLTSDGTYLASAEAVRPARTASATRGGADELRTLRPHGDAARRRAGPGHRRPRLGPPPGGREDLRPGGRLLVERAGDGRRPKRIIRRRCSRRGGVLVTGGNQGIEANAEVYDPPGTSPWSRQRADARRALRARRRCWATGGSWSRAAKGRNHRPQDRGRSTTRPTAPGPRRRRCATRAMRIRRRCWTTGGSSSRAATRAARKARLATAEIFDPATRSWTAAGADDRGAPGAHGDAAGRRAGPRHGRRRGRLHQPRERGDLRPDGRHLDRSGDDDRRAPRCACGDAAGRRAGPGHGRLRAPLYEAPNARALEPRRAQLDSGSTDERRAPGAHGDAARTMGGSWSRAAPRIRRGSAGSRARSCTTRRPIAGRRELP